MASIQYERKGVPTHIARPESQWSYHTVQYRHYYRRYLLTCDYYKLVNIKNFVGIEPRAFTQIDYESIIYKLLYFSKLASSSKCDSSKYLYWDISS